MKKFVVIAAVMLIGAGAALAASINVPFFLDTTAAGGTFPPTSGTMFFIGLKNTTASPVMLTISYRDALGVDSTGVVGNVTFSLSAFESISYRPHIKDPAVESTNTVTKDPVRSTSTAGAARFMWSGGTNDIQGRGVQVSGTGGGSFAFLLPPGI